MGLTQAVTQGLIEAVERYQASSEQPLPRAGISEVETVWHKLDHLLYLPILGLRRPRDLYYYQGAGLRVLYGFTYKYLTLEQFLGQLSQLQVGYGLADRLAYQTSQVWYPGQEALFIMSDWHAKPHWTKTAAHSGHMTMWGRTMPGCKQLIINGPDGRLVGAWNHPVDSHFSQIMVKWEANLANVLKRPIAYNILDGEGAGVTLAQRYAEAQQGYLSVLPRQGDQSLAVFQVQGTWQPVVNDPDHEAVDAAWADPEKAAADPRRLILMRRQDDSDPTRVYAGLYIDQLSAAQVPHTHRQRWIGQERRIRELIHGANLNVNYGFTYAEVPNRTRRRSWEKAQAQVEVTQTKLAEREEAVANLNEQLHQLHETYQAQQAALDQAIAAKQEELQQRQQAGKPVRRVQQGLARHQRQLQAMQERWQRRQQKRQQALVSHHARIEELQEQLREREALRNAIDTETLCRERHLEKDQIMLNLQVMLLNLHDWAAAHYFAPSWQRLTLETATKLIYCKSGRVTWHPDRLEVVLDSYRYPEHQQAMEATCQRFNAADARWRDGRLIRISVAPCS
jgi:hypothetical protein